MDEYEVIVKRFQDEIDHIVGALASSSVSDWQEYKFLTGKIAAFNTAIDIVKDIRARRLSDDAL